MSNEIKTAIVTGASRGIGAAIARELAADGFQTVVNYAASAAQAEEVVAAIATAGGRALALHADVSDPQAVADLFERTEAEFGTVEVLVNNAGVTTFGPLSDVSDEDYHRLVAVNLTGTFNGMREGARRLRDGASYHQSLHQHHRALFAGQCRLRGD